MACDRRSARPSVASASAVAAAAAAALCLLVFIPAASSQRAAVYAPVVVSAHDPASGDAVHDAAIGAGAYAPAPAPAPEPVAVQSAPSAGISPAAGNAPVAQSASLHLSTGHSDNDVTFRSSAPAGNASQHAEAREEANNRIADPRASVPSAPPPAASTGPIVFTDAADVADAATIPPQVADAAPALPVNTNGSGTASSVSITSASPLPSTSSTTASPDRDASRASPDANSRAIQFVSGTQQLPSPKKNTSVADKGAPPVGGAVAATADPAHDETSAHVQTEGAELEGYTTEYYQKVIPDDFTTESATTVTDNIEDTDKTTLYSNVEEGLAEGFNGSDAQAHPCARECVAGAPPMRCHYRFEVSGYYTMSKACYDCPARREDCDLPHCIAADGVPRGLVVVNRQMPGPAVEVCFGDRVIVDLHNGLVAETTSVHWHGHHQRGTPYMDGVPHVTQCPVPPMTTFRYAFKADTPGTHFWHSHTGHQRADGAFGSLVVRVPRESDPQAALYDRDERAHTLLVLDWGAAGGVERFLAHHHGSGPNKPTALLINGRGRVPPSPLPPTMPTAVPPDVYASATAAAAPPVPAPEFVVKQGLRYRFRLINAGFVNCPVEMSVDGHDMLIISSDGSDIHPVAAASLVSYAGERFDFVLEANRSVGAYWIRMRGLLDGGESFTAVHQAAILRYEGATDVEPPGELSYAAAYRPGHQVNSLNVGTNHPGSSVIPELDALSPDDESLKKEPDYRFYLAYDFYALDNPHFHMAPHYGFYNVTNKVRQTYTPQFNHISMKMPPVPMLPQYEQLDQRQFCNASSVAGRGCEHRYCECAHVIQVPLNSVLELVLVDEGVTYNANHPFHLHGHAFRVVAMERVGESTTLEEVKRLDARGLIKRKLHAAPLKDTCTVPDGGYTILRVRASNPGYWLFHCHIEFHVEIGMALVFKIGEHSDFPPVPKGFPRCGDWTPEDDDDDDDDDDAREIEDRRASEGVLDNEVAGFPPSGSPQNSHLRESLQSSAPRLGPGAAILSTLLLASMALMFQSLGCSR